MKEMETKSKIMPLAPAEKVTKCLRRDKSEE